MKKKLDCRHGFSAPSVGGKVRKRAVRRGHFFKGAARIRAVASAIKEERIAAPAKMHLCHLAEKSTMIAAVDFRISRAFELRQHICKQGASIFPFSVGASSQQAVEGRAKAFDRDSCVWARMFTANT